MDKRIIIVPVVALLAVVLAVVLIGSPDTGGEVVERELTVPEPVAVAPSSEEVVRVGEPKATVTDPHDPSQTTEGITAPLAVKSLPPAKAQVLLNRANPESEWAARAMAPWTEVRRQLQQQGGSPELVERINVVLGDIRKLRLNGTAVDFDQLSADQEQLRSDIVSSPHTNADIEKMFSTLDARADAYEAGTYDP